MSLSILDPCPALVIVDLQQGTAAAPFAHPVDTVVGNAAALTAAFRARDLTVAAARVTGFPPGRTEVGRRAAELPAGWADPLDALPDLGEDIVVRRGRWGAFSVTDLDAQLRDRGVTQVLIAGVATSFGIESTARAAYDLGYHVVVVADATTDMSVDAYKYAIERIFPVLGEIATTAEIIAALPAPGPVGGASRAARGAGRRPTQRDD